MTGPTAPAAGMSMDERLRAAGLPALPRPCWIEIDEEALAANLRAIRELAGTGTEVAAVVKSDGYGHGIEGTARALERAGADSLCVASFDEAVLLRDRGVRAPLVVLFPVPPTHVADAVALGLELVASEEGNVRDLLARSRGGSPGKGVGLRLHLEIETGLGRGGVRPAAAAALAGRIEAEPPASLAGVWTHLANGDDPEVSAHQIDEFERAVAGLRTAGVQVPRRHAAATAGLFAGTAPAYEMVRPGLALYGVVPEDLPLSATGATAAAQLRPVASLKCRALRLEWMDPGERVGYGGRWVAERRSLVATLPVGYGDGWTRAYAAGSQALLRGRRVPLIGTVAMDAVMADVTDVPDVSPEDEFVLLGASGADTIDASELARRRTTIAWEVLATLAQRIPRVYHAGTVLTGVRTLVGEYRPAPHGAPGSPGRGRSGGDIGEP